MAKFKPVSHIIFDMDGILLDTEPLYMRVFQNIAAKYGKTFTWELKEKVMGYHRSELAKFVVRELDLPITWQEYTAALCEEYKTVLANPNFCCGAQTFVNHLFKHNIPMSVATSSSKDTVELKTEKFKDFLKMFHHIVCGGSDPEVKYGKPSPDIFLVSASRFSDKPKPEKCLVIEDAPNGVQAALRAGMQVVMIPDKKVSAELRKDATMVVTSLLVLPLEKFGLPPLKS